MEQARLLIKKLNECYGECVVVDAVKRLGDVEEGTLASLMYQPGYKFTCGAVSLSYDVAFRGIVQDINNLLAKLCTINSANLHGFFRILEELRDCGEALVRSYHRLRNIVEGLDFRSRCLFDNGDELLREYVKNIYLAVEREAEYFLEGDNLKKIALRENISWREGLEQLLKEVESP